MRLRWAGHIFGCLCALVAGLLLWVPGAPVKAAAIDWAPLALQVIGVNTAAASSTVIGTVEQRDNVVEVTWDWWATDAETLAVQVSGPVSGELWKAYFQPDSDAPPDDNYDVVLKDVVEESDGAGGVQLSAAETDLTSGGLANIDADATDVKSFYPTTHVPIVDRLQIEISGHGGNCGGRVKLYIYRNP